MLHLQLKRCWSQTLGVKHMTWAIPSGEASVPVQRDWSSAKHQAQRIVSAVSSCLWHDGNLKMLAVLPVAQERSAKNEPPSWHCLDPQSSASWSQIHLKAFNCLNQSIFFFLLKIIWTGFSVTCNQENHPDLYQENHSDLFLKHVSFYQAIFSTTSVLFCSENKTWETEKVNFN